MITLVLFKVGSKSPEDVDKEYLRDARAYLEEDSDCSCIFIVLSCGLERVVAEGTIKQGDRDDIEDDASRVPNQHVCVYEVLGVSFHEEATDL